MVLSIKQLSGTAAACLALVAAGCIKSSGQKLASVPDTLTINALLVDGSGAPVAGAAVTAESDQTVLATSGPDGRVHISLSQTQAAAIAHNLDANRQTFCLYFATSGQSYYTASPPISAQDIGDKDLGSITLSAPGGYSGTVLTARSGKIVGPASNAIVTIGPIKLTVRTDGTFSNAKLPSGKLPLTVSAPSYHAFNDTVAIASQQQQQRSDSIILFATGGPDGVLVEKNDDPLALLVASGHPTGKHFSVHPADNTAFVRVATDLKSLQALAATDKQGTAAILANANASTGVATPPASPTPTPGATSADIPWQPVGQDLSVDFPNNGGQFLYYQFGDLNHDQVSPIYQTGVNINVFADSDGFVIGDGTSPSPSSRVTINVHVPKAGVGMRFAENLKDFANTPYRSIAPTLTYDFLPLLADGSNGGEPMARELYGQFRDAYGHESAVFHATTTLALFQSKGIVIADGSGQVNSQVVPVTFDLPPGVASVRLDEGPLLVRTQVWQPAAPKLNFTFKPQEDLVNFSFYVAGSRQICAQMQDINGFISPTFCQQVFVDLFKMPGVGFIVANSDPVTSFTPYRTVSLAIAVPPNAKEMRIYEEAPDNSTVSNTIANIFQIGSSAAIIARTTWLTANPQAVYTFATVGSKVLDLQFRDASGLVSSAYEQPVIVVPFCDAGATWIDIDGIPPPTPAAPQPQLVTDPVLHVHIHNLPPSAVSMAAFLDTDLSVPIFVPAADHLDIPMYTPGLKRVLVQFKNADNDLSSTFQDIVYFDPFPGNLLHLDLGNGTGVTNTPQFPIQITSPSFATGYRIATDKTALAALPYQALSNNLTYTLPSGSQSGVYEVFVQLQDNIKNGFIESVVFSSHITLDLFPANTVSLAVNNLPSTANTANITTSQTVPVTITGPADTSGYRIGTDPTALASATFQAFNGTVTNASGTTPALSTLNTTFTLPAASGNYTVYVQLQKANGNNSLVYSQPIKYSPIPAGSISFVVGDGSGTVTNPSGTVNVTVTFASSLQIQGYKLTTDQTTLSGSTFNGLQSVPTSPLVLPFKLPSAAGNYTVYLQIQDTSGNTSLIYTQPVVFNPFPAGSIAFIVGDGSGTAASNSNIALNITAPAQAVSYRLATDVAALSAAPLLSLGNGQNLSFSLPAQSGNYTVFLQVFSAQGLASLIFSQPLTLNAFPGNNAAILVNNGNAVTPTSAIPIAISGAVNAAAYRVSTDPNAFASASPPPWNAMQPSVTFNLPAQAGSYTVYVQLLSTTNDISPVFSKPITLVPFAQGTVALTLNNGNPTTSSATFPISITAPGNTASYRLSIDANNLAGAPWISPQGPATFTLPTPVPPHTLYTVYMQLQTTTGEISLVYTAQISSN